LNPGGLLALPGKLLIVVVLMLASVSACDSRVSSLDQQDQKPTTQSERFTVFESGHVRPLALSEDGKLLFVVNTPDSRLEVFSTASGVPVFVEAVVVGLEPVAVAVREKQAWVVNHLSDSVSIVDFSSSPFRVIKTLYTGDEPRDIVFAGSNRDRAFISAAHRGQNAGFDPELFTSGVGRSDVWVFDRQNVGDALGGSPLTVVNMLGDTIRGLAVSNDAQQVYAAVFNSGNRTTTVYSDIANGGLSKPPPLVSSGGVPAPRTGLIVKFNGQDWLDNGDTATATEPAIWNDRIRFTLPDNDVFIIDAMLEIPESVNVFRSVGTTLYNVAVNPANSDIYISNTESKNDIRFTGAGVSSSTLKGRFAENRLSIISSGNVYPRQLNKTARNLEDSNPADSQKKLSVALPQAMSISSDGQVLYLAAFGSQKIVRYRTTELKDNTFIPNQADQLMLSEGGPSGVVLDERAGKLYVFTRFDNGISTIDTERFVEIDHQTLFNPEPVHVIEGRRFLYDASISSGEGELSCAVCHPFADTDHLAWDLGVPDADVEISPNIYTDAIPEIFSKNRQFHPMKGPMVTQSLRGLAGNGPMHWRGDKTGVTHLASETLEEQALEDFNESFVSLLGRHEMLEEAQIDLLARFLLEIDYPPNPIRALDNSLSETQQAGEQFFRNVKSVALSACNACHVVDPESGQFGTEGKMSIDGGLVDEDFKIPHLRNIYQKVGMFGSTAHPSDGGGDQGDQIRGFGFTHSGAFDTLINFFKAPVFSFPSDAKRREVAEFVMAMSSEHAPVVGQQLTIDSQSISNAVYKARLDLMVEQASAATGNCELVATGVVDDTTIGAYYNEQGLFSFSSVSKPTQALIPLLATIDSAADYISFTCVPLGNGRRIGIDRDLDGVLNHDSLDH